MDMVSIAKQQGLKGVWFAEDGEIFISVEVGSEGARHLENLPLSQPAAEGWLRTILRKTHSRAAHKNEIENFRNELISHAYEGQIRVDTFLRVAEYGGNLYIDLGRPDWSIVEITPEGYSVTQQTPVAAFRRSLSTHPMPLPEAGGSLDLLKDFINLQSDEDFLLLCSWLISTYHPNGDYIHLFLTGEYGSAKTTTARFLQQLIHPSSSSTKAPPKDESTLMIEAYHNRLVMIDNENMLDGFLPNALCRLSTGSGHSARELYTNRNQVSFSVSRPVVMTSHKLPTQQRDLIDRSLNIELFAPSRRITKGRLNESFEKVYPLILGAIFDILSVIMRNRRTYKEEDFNLPRMSDAAYWIICGADKLGWPSPENFLQAFRSNQLKMLKRGDPVDDPLILRLKECMTDREVWEDTPENIFNELVDMGRRAQGLPKAPNVLSKRLNQLAGFLTLLDFKVETGLHAKSGVSRLIRITKLKNEADTSLAEREELI